MSCCDIGKLTYLFFFSLILSGCLGKLIADTPTVSEKEIVVPSLEYKQIDKHALNAPKAVEESIPTLAAYLIKPARNEREKARAIYRWITHNIAYDDKGFFSGHYERFGKQDVLKSRRAVCDGYAGLFKRLGQSAGLEVVDISGYSKGYSYATRQSDSINHAWNAVKIDGQWQLIDATWGAGYLDSKQKRFIRRFQAHYFLTPPEQFIYDHFPTDSKWQLLPLPVAKSEYNQWVYLRPAFFQNGLAIGSHPNGVINTSNQLTVTLRTPTDVKLLAQLLQDKQELDKSHTFFQRQADQYSIHVSFPKTGEYILRVFAKQQDEPGSYHWALDYRIVASQSMAINKIPVAPEQAFFDAGLKVASHPYHQIKTEKQVMVTILAPAGILMSAKLYLNNQRLDKSFTFVQKRAGQYEIHAVFPKPDDYILRLFAKRRDAGIYYDSVLDYQVKVSRGMSGEIGFPNTSGLFKEKNSYLYHPMHRYLKMGSTQTFKLAVPTAESVVVIIGNNNFFLKQRGELFEGKVLIEKGKIGIYAKFPGNRSYGNLLEYFAD